MSSKNSSNKLNVPEARAAMDKFKMEAASDFRVKRHIKLQPPMTAEGPQLFQAASPRFHFMRQQLHFSATTYPQQQMQQPLKGTSILWMATF